MCFWLEVVQPSSSSADMAPWLVVKIWSLRAGNFFGGEGERAAGRSISLSMPWRVVLHTCWGFCFALNQARQKRNNWSVCAQECSWHRPKQRFAINRFVGHIHNRSCRASATSRISTKRDGCSLLSLTCRAKLSRLVRGSIHKCWDTRFPPDRPELGRVDESHPERRLCWKLQHQHLLPQRLCQRWQQESLSKAQSLPPRV